MTMETQKFQRKPFPVEAVLVTVENMDEVANWCAGKIQEDHNEETCWIKVQVHHPMNVKQTRAYVGDWVLFANGGFKIYTEAAFKKNFEPVMKQVPLS